MGYGSVKSITIDHTKVGAINNTDQTDYPLLIYGDYSYLATVANGGLIQHTTTFNGQTVPADFLIASDVAGASPLKFSFITYITTSGHATVKIRVKVPTVSHSTNTVIYMLYGNSAVTTYQGGTLGQAAANYAAYLPYPDGTTLSLKDYSANGNNGSIQSASITATTSILDGAAAGDGAGNITLGNSSTLNCVGAVTLEGIVTDPQGLAGIAPSYLIYKSNTVTGANWDYHFGIGPTSASNSAIGFNNTNVGSLAMSAPWVSPGNNYFSVTADGSNWLVYLNGVLVATHASAQTPGANTNPCSLFNFPGSAGSGDGYHGFMSENRISSVVRSADWINTEYKNMSSPSTFYTLATASTFYTGFTIICVNS